MMKWIDNIGRVLGDNLKQTIRPAARLKTPVSCLEQPRNNPKFRELKK
jgi:hypothetical protein